MASKEFKVSSEEGAVFASTEFHQVTVGDKVELEVTADQERALIAAGWLEHVKGGKK